MNDWLEIRHWVKAMSPEDATRLENLIVEYHRDEGDCGEVIE